jgi:hypothetical protein
MTSKKLLQLVRSNYLLTSSNIGIQDSEVYIAASLAQSELLRDYHLLEEKISFSLLSGKETYDSDDIEELAYALYLRDKMSYTDDTKKILVQTTQNWVASQKERDAADGTAISPPRYFYSLKTDPLSFGVYGIPQTSYSVEAWIGVGATEDDDITEAISPLIPDAYQDLFLTKTLAKIMLLRGTEFAKEAVYFEGLSDKIGQRVRLALISSQGAFTPIDREDW